MNIRSKTGDGVQVVVIAWFNSRERCKSAPLVYPTLEDAVDEWDKKVCDHHFMFTDFKGRKNIVLTKHLYELTIEEYTGDNNKPT